jgi:hypothetical protein
MDGDLAPLRDIVELKDQYGAVLLLDEAHAVGVLGRGGRGLADQLGLAHRIEVQMGTLGKALGSSGGYIAGSSALNATKFCQTFVRHAGVHWRKATKFVPNLFRRFIFPVVTHLAGKVKNNLNVVASVSGRVDCFSNALHAALRVGDCAVTLAPRSRTREYNIGELRCFGQEKILHDEEIEVLE